MDNFDYTGYILRYDVLHNTNNIFANGAFESDDGRVVPIIHTGDGHNYCDTPTHLGYAILEQRADGMVAKCMFADYDAGRIAKELVVYTKEMGLSIYATGISYDYSARPVHKILSGRIGAVIIIPMDRMPRPVEEEPNA